MALSIKIIVFYQGVGGFMARHRGRGGQFRRGGHNAGCGRGGGHMLPPSSEIGALRDGQCSYYF